MTYQAIFTLPCAALGIRTAQGKLVGIDFLPAATPALAPQDDTARQTCAQLAAYLKDPDFRFDLPIETHGTPFREKVWRGLREIPAGAPLTYGQLATRLGTAPRAVGQACGANPLPVVIPCHRVVGGTGLGGFMNSGDGDPLAIKRWLLAHEQRQSA
ncbi:MAG: methylated-DNA--[protein]-cysteine S-methyltransferase [Sulfuricella sp.]|nr:methylated-DNA--[protein]-cysteine S-methyltransferase [Sulfuricella sp.]